MNETIFNAFDSIDCLSAQISAILELIMMADTSTAPSAMTTAAEMCLDMHTDLMKEVNVINAELKKGYR